MKALLSLILVVLVAVAAVFLLREDEGTNEPASTATFTEEVKGADAAEMTARAESKDLDKKKERRELPRKHKLYFPDGTWLPALNGATNPKPVTFRDRPYSPVVRKAYDPKFKRHWYVHANGSWSTTVPMNFRGQKNTITQVMHPGGKPNILLDEGPNGERKAIMPNKKKKKGKRAGADGGAKQPKEK